MMPRYRRISPNEWSYLAAARAFPPLAIQLWIRAEGLPALHHLEAALETAARMNPGARLVQRDRWWLDSGRAPACRRLSSTGSFTAGYELFQQPLSEARVAPPIEVVTVEGSGLVFRCSHALMDARGLLFFAEETFRALRGEPLLGTSSHEPDDQVLRRFANGQRRGWPRRASASPVGAADSAASGFLWVHRSAPSSPAMSARIISALIESARGRAANSPADFMLPIDLRRHSGLQTTANQSNPILARFNAHTPWQEIYRQNLTALAAHRQFGSEPRERLTTWLPASLIAYLMRSVHHTGVRQDRYFFNAVVSDVGEVSLARLSCAGSLATSASFLPVDTPGAALTLVLTSHENGVELHASAPAATADRGRLANLLERLVSATRDEPVQPSSIFTQPTLTELFASQAAATPHLIALREGAHTCTYAELDQRSRRWARRLHDRGVSEGDRVAVLASRSIDTVVLLLGILRRGAAFVPLDPSWPTARITRVLDDCRPAIIVTDSDEAPFTAAPVLRMADESTPRVDVAVVADAAANPDSPAYVMYTSGSTGQSKGVVIPHGSLSNYLLWARGRYLPPDCRPVFPLFTSLAFDLTQTALWLPLISGGEARIIAAQDALLAARAILSDADITAIKLTPSHLRLLSDLGMQHGGVRTLIVGGEALPASLARDALRRCPLATLFNEYGPTEATVGCIVSEFDAHRMRDNSVPIGTPIANTSIHLLDPRGERVADGDVGEIVIAGACVATGYLTPSPDDARFLTIAGERAYRSGDLGSLIDGEYRYHGRLDEQVKVRGHRIEIGEVESLLAAQNSVTAAAVVLTGTQLTAFVIWRDGPQPDALRAALADSLPEYMMPCIETVAELPLTVNGKVDKARLAGGRSSEQLASTRGISAPRAAAPSDPLQRELLEMLGGIIGRAPQDLLAHRSMLDQGVDSLHLATLLNQAAERHLPAEKRSALFEELEEFVSTPTIERLARRLSKVQARPPLPR